MQAVRVIHPHNFGKIGLLTNRIISDCHAIRFDDGTEVFYKKIWLVELPWQPVRVAIKFSTERAVLVKQVTDDIWLVRNDNGSIESYHSSWLITR